MHRQSKVCLPYLLSAINHALDLFIEGFGFDLRLNLVDLLQVVVLAHLLFEVFHDSIVQAFGELHLHQEAYLASPVDLVLERSEIFLTALFFSAAKIKGFTESFNTFFDCGAFLTLLPL